MRFPRGLPWFLASFSAFCLLIHLAAAPSTTGHEQRPSSRLRPWTYDDAKLALEHSPRDPYLQYVAVQLARRENRLRDDQHFFQSLFNQRNFGRRERVDLFNTFTGALAVQESLQLDTLLEGTNILGQSEWEGFPPPAGSVPPQTDRRPEPAQSKEVAPPAPEKLPEKRPDRPTDQPKSKSGEKYPEKPPEKRIEGPNETAPVRPAAHAEPQPQKKGVPRPRPTKEQDPSRKVPLASLQGPTIKSHPWKKMLAGRKPDIGALALCVPEDFYFVEFKSAAKLTQALESANLWGDHLLTQMLGKSESQDSEKRIKKQLGIQGIPPALFDTLGLEGIAVAGSDLYLADGSDVTLLVLGKRIVALREAADGILRRSGNIKAEAGEYLGIKYTHVFNSDLSVNSLAADPCPDLHIRSNSLPAFQRILQAVAGRTPDGQSVRRLGETSEFAYIRTILPREAAEEDGIIYLSDPCIRRLVGPRVKLTQQRRLRAFNHLKMIEHAALMFRTEKGRPPRSFRELADSGCAPGLFGEGRLACPAGGTYALSADGMSGVSSIFGSPEMLTPLLEINLADVTEKEARAYEAFLNDYNQYWRTYFDPIAVRVKVSPEQYRLETVVLPLIDNTIYMGLAQTLGGETVALDGLPVPSKAIHTISTHINKQPVLEMLNEFLPPDQAGEQPRPAPRDAAANPRSMREIMIAMHNYHNDYACMPPQAFRTPDRKKPLLSWRVHLLPYMERDNLYRRFKLDESWDSEHNQKLIAEMPAIYRGASAELNKQGKTRFLVPVGKNTVFPPDGKKMSLGQISAMDGTSNTVGLIEATEDRAVIWTKPEDWGVDLQDPGKGVVQPGRTHFLAAMCDGSVRRVPATISAQDLANLLTVNDGNLVALAQLAEADGPMAGPRGRRGGPFPDDLFGLDPRKVRDFLTKGIGDQVSFHVLDSSFPFNAEISGFASTRSPLADFGPMRMGMIELASFGMFAQSLTHPFCIMIPVKDAKIVDDFLAEIDKRFAQEWARDIESFIHLEQYRMQSGDKQIRVFAIKVLGLSLRFCWCRSGDLLMIANQTQVLEQLESQAAKGKPNDKTMMGHAMYRVRPENWGAVLPDYRLGFEENQRAACHVNLGRIANVARAYPELVKPDGSAMPELLGHVHRLYGVRPYCPDGGTYNINPEGKVSIRETARRIFRRSSQEAKEYEHVVCSCSIHGDRTAPRQLAAPSENSATAQTLKTFAGLRATLTFMEDGLHAVVIIDRKP